MPSITIEAPDWIGALFPAEPRRFLFLVFQRRSVADQIVENARLVDRLHERLVIATKKDAAS